MQKGLATRVVQVELAAKWHLNGDWVLWTDYDGNVSVRNLRPYHGSGKPALEIFQFNIFEKLACVGELTGAVVTADADVVVSVGDVERDVGIKRAKARQGYGEHARATSFSQ